MSPSDDALPVAIDAMGGDDAPEAIVAGALLAAQQGLRVTLVGDEARIRTLLPRASPIGVVHAADVVGMDEAATAVRRRDQSSIRVTMDLVRRKEACAAVSCGNSGAVLVAGVLDLGVLEGIDRPAIATILPRRDGGRLVLLDAGANVDTKPEHLARFALLGTAYARCLGVETPRVGLLSNGEESSKGNDQVKAALPLIEAMPVSFVGPVEPPAALAGACDVLVCDGFVGNVMLKAVEGAADTLLALLKEEIRRRPSAVLGAWLLQRALRRFRKRISWDVQGGGVLVGINEVVVVGHGRANAAAVHSAVALAARAASERLVERIRRRLDTPADPPSPAR